MTSPISDSFRALVARETSPGTFETALETRSNDELPAGEVTIAVAYSSLNYKDMLVATGHRGITKRYPHTPGIDAAGVVVESSDASVTVGSNVAVVGYDLGMNTSGGLAQRIRVPASWVLSLPPGLDARAAMAHGTAGVTASLSVRALLDAGVTKDDGEVLVTGASGGVGAIAVAILSKLGFRVVAVSRRSEATELLRAIGAVDVVAPETAITGAGKPMGKERWAAAVDTVGGELLFEVVKSLRYGGAVAACGMAGGNTFTGNVFPFILRGARLLGVDSVELPRPRKQAALDALAATFRIESLDRIATEIPLADAPKGIADLRAGRVLGRVLVRVAD